MRRKHKHNWKRGVWYYLGWKWRGKECLICHFKRMTHKLTQDW